MKYRIDLEHETLFGLDLRTVRPGIWVKPDWWPTDGRLFPLDVYEEDYFPGAMRISTGLSLIPSLPVRVTITGRTAIFNGTTYKVRAKIEFLLDGEPSETTGAVVYFPAHDDY